MDWILVINRRHFEQVLAQWFERLDGYRSPGGVVSIRRAAVADPIVSTARPDGSIRDPLIIGRMMASIKSRKTRAEVTARQTDLA